MRGLEKNLPVLSFPCHAERRLENSRREATVSKGCSVLATTSALANRLASLNSSIILEKGTQLLQPRDQQHGGSDT